MDYKNCACRNSIVDKLIEECTNAVDESEICNETLSVTPLNAIPSDNCASCTPYIVLFAVFLTTSVIIGHVFVYFYWYRKNKQLDFEKYVSDIKYSKTKTLIY